MPSGNETGATNGEERLPVPAQPRALVPREDARAAFRPDRPSPSRRLLLATAEPFLECGIETLLWLRAFAVTVTRRSGAWLGSRLARAVRSPFLPELLVAALFIANSVFYAADSAGILTADVQLAQGFGAALRDGLDSGSFEAMRQWLKPFWLQPPLYHALLGLCPFPYTSREPLMLLVWSNLLVWAGALALAAALRRGGRPRTAGIASLLLVGGFPLVNAYTKVFHPEAGLFAFTALALACLLGSRDGLPSRWRSPVFGLVLGAALLCKWTCVLYLAVPILLGAATCATRKGSLGEPLLRLGVAAVFAIALAGPWYAIGLDWQRAIDTVIEEPTAETRGASPDRDRIELLEEESLRSVGELLLPLTLAASLLAFLTRRPGIWTALGSAVVPLLLMPLFAHLEPVYLLPALPGLAAAATLGLTLPGPRLRLVLTIAVACLAATQTLDRTWSRQENDPRHMVPGELASIDPQMYMLRASGSLYLDIAGRTRYWADLLSMPPDRRSFMVHSLEANPDIKGGLMRYHGALPAEPGGMKYAGHDWHELRSCAIDLLGGPVSFILLSEATLSASTGLSTTVAELGRDLAGGEQAWTDRERRALVGDPFLLDEIRKRFGVLETLSTDRGAIFVLVRRSVWARLRTGETLGNLPVPERRQPGAETRPAP